MLSRSLRERDYDLVLDSQGLFKSALLGRLTKAPIYGFDAKSAREPGATKLYKEKFRVEWGQSAIARNRQLFAHALDYRQPSEAAVYGLKIHDEALTSKHQLENISKITDGGCVIGFHGTTWKNKEWVDDYWLLLANALNKIGFSLLMPAGNVRESDRVTRIAKLAKNVVALPPTSLFDLAQIIKRCKAFVGVDTGLSYLASALGTPGVTIYGPTANEQENVSGLVSLCSTESCSPCGESRCKLNIHDNVHAKCQYALHPDQVFKELVRYL